MAVCERRDALVDGPGMDLVHRDHRHRECRQPGVAERLAERLQPLRRAAYGRIVVVGPVLELDEDRPQVDLCREVRVSRCLGHVDDRVELGEQLGRRAEGHARADAQDGQLDACPSTDVRLVVGRRAHQAERRPGRGERLVDRVAVEPIAGVREVVVDGLLGLASLLEMHRQDPGQLAMPVGVERFERLPDLAVQLAALLLEQ